MWQIMWMLNLLPDVIWHLLLIISLVTIAFTYFLRMIPFVGANSVQLRFAAIAILVLTVWMEGGIANEAKWQERVRELEAQVAAAEKAAAEANGKIETVYVDRVEVVKEVQYVVRKEIEQAANELDANCRIPPRAIELLNQATGTKK
jgi:NADH:ubiquinone oxidoreductase subunit 6 (subunit J)